MKKFSILFIYVFCQVGQVVAEPTVDLGGMSALYLRFGLLPYCADRYSYCPSKPMVGTYDQVTFSYGARLDQMRNMVSKNLSEKVLENVLEFLQKNRERLIKKNKRAFREANESALKLEAELKRRIISTPREQRMREELLRSESEKLFNHTRKLENSMIRLQRIFSLPQEELPEQ